MNTTILTCAGCGSHLPAPENKYAKCGSCGGVNYINENKVESILQRKDRIGQYTKEFKERQSKKEPMQTSEIIKIVAGGLALMAISNILKRKRRERGK